MRTFQIKSQKLLLTMYKPYSISSLGFFFKIAPVFILILKIIAFFYVRTVYYIFLCKTRARAFFYWHPGYHGINKYDDSDFHRSLINLTKCFLDFVFRYRYRYLKLLYTVYTSILDNICPLPLPQKNFFFYNSSLYFLQNDSFRENDPTPHIVVT